jgi:zinc transport system permease protein
MSFFESSFLWLEAVIAAVAVGVLCAVMGIHAILRRVVFLPAALSQISGLGVVLAFAWGAGATGADSHTEGHGLGFPEVFSLAVTLAAVFWLGWMREPRFASRDAVIGMAFALASALVIGISAHLPQEAHEIGDVLYGNAVAVERDRMWLALGVAAGLVALHLALWRPFLLVAHDPETAAAHGVPVRLLEAVLFLSLGLGVAVATRTIGALPVFAYAVLPPAAGLMAFRDVRAAMAFAAVGAAAAAFFGYYASFVWNLPTGACSVVASGALLIPAAVIRALR